MAPLSFSAVVRTLSNTRVCPFEPVCDTVKSEVTRKVTNSRVLAQVAASASESSVFGSSAGVGVGEGVAVAVGRGVGTGVAVGLVVAVGAGGVVGWLVAVDAATAEPLDDSSSDVVPLHAAARRRVPTIARASAAALRVVVAGLVVVPPLSTAISRVGGTQTPGCSRSRCGTRRGWCRCRPRRRGRRPWGRHWRPDRLRAHR